MSPQPTSNELPRLLPSELENRLFGWFFKTLGAALLAACIIAALSLMSWSVADPSLTHATSGLTRNLAGPLGAIFSDLLMQTLGLASVVALLPPAFWALQLITRENIPGLKSKLVLAAGAVKPSPQHSRPCRRPPVGRSVMASAASSAISASACLATRCHM